VLAANRLEKQCVSTSRVPGKVVLQQASMRKPNGASSGRSASGGAAVARATAKEAAIIGIASSLRLPVA